MNELQHRKIWIFILNIISQSKQNDKIYINTLNILGRGPDYENPSNININDALGDYSLTLIDVLGKEQYDVNDNIFWSQAFFDTQKLLFQTYTKI